MSSAHVMTAESTGSRSTARPPAAVHVDLDGVTHIFRLHGWQWPERDDPVYESGVRHALDLFDALHVRATFFVIAEDLEHPQKAEWLREIVRRGHDVASHSVTHSPLRPLSRDRKREEIVDSRDRIAAALGRTPSGFRAPNFSIDAESLELLAEAGYVWDSSLMPGARIPGLEEEVAAMPVRIAGALLELPLPAYRPLPFSFHPSYSLVLGIRYFRLGLARFRQTGAPLVLLFHLVDFADPLPASRLRGWAQRLYTLSYLDGGHKRERCRRMLEAVRDGCDILETAELVNRYRETARRPES